MMTSLERLPPMTKWWLQVVRIVLLLPCCNTAAHILSLQFDGSLRPPSDPGFATASLGRIGTAAAALSLIDHDASGQQKPTNPLWLGGKALPPGGLENSAEAEYEGLLMGLEKAVELVGVSTVVVDKIVVQGDCKTVIDQLKESSRPRKLEAHYIRAQEHLTQLLGEQQGPVVLEYQHIPRKQNQLCDGLCTVIRSRIIEPAAWQRSMAGMDDDQADLSRSLQDLVRPGSLIPFSRRPQIYAKLASVAQEREDFQVVVQVGEQLEHESKTVWASSAAGKDVAEKLQTWGVALQIQGYRGQATRKSLKLAAAKERKNRFLLKQQQAKVLGAFEDWGSTDLEQDAGEETGKAELSLLWQAWLDEMLDSKQWCDQKCLWIVRGRG